ncbi:MAG: anaerobic ribonucleoside-triphosphate reductase [Eggerthellaceae bacterium]
MQTLYTSGTVFHAFLGEKLPELEGQRRRLVRKIAENYKLPYYTMSPTYSVCPNHGYLAGEVWECPECGSETEVYSRITGYYRPVKHWNDGKVQEYKDRREYQLDASPFSEAEHHGRLLNAEEMETAPSYAPSSARAVAVTKPRVSSQARAQDLPYADTAAKPTMEATAAMLQEAEAALADAAQAEQPNGAPVEGSTLLPAGRYLLATYTCPNCKRAADMMDQAGIAYEEVFAEEYPELVEQLGVMQAPTLVDVAGDGSMDVEASGAMQVFKRLKDLEAQA